MSDGVFSMLSFFFFQAEDGIRDYKVTGVQTCALPISAGDGGDLARRRRVKELAGDLPAGQGEGDRAVGFRRVQAGDGAGAAVVADDLAAGVDELVVGDLDVPEARSRRSEVACGFVEADRGGPGACFGPGTGRGGGTARG